MAVVEEAMTLSNLTEREIFDKKMTEEVSRWFLMGGPWPVLLITLSYLVFVRIGPELMKDRKPMKIKSIILVYNLYQTISNAYLVLLLFITPGGINYIWNHSCHPLPPHENPMYYKFIYGSWLFFFSKIVDLLDTVFFILRKKNSHITFLHVYHHANMVLSTWAFLEYARGEQGLIVGIVNSFVHVVMYSYYFLAALGPEVQKYLWWKKYITRLQMVQFLIFILYMFKLMFGGCEAPKALVWYIVFEGFVFFCLFANFYIKTYILKSNKPKSEVAASAETEKIK